MGWQRKHVWVGIIALSAVFSSSVSAKQDACWMLDLESSPAQMVENAKALNSPLYTDFKRYEDLIYNGSLLQELEKRSGPEARFMEVALTLTAESTRCSDDSQCGSAFRGATGQSALEAITALSDDHPDRLDLAMAALRLCSSVKGVRGRSDCLQRYGLDLASRFPDNAATALISAAAAADRDDFTQLEHHLKAAARTGRFETGSKAARQMSIDLLNELLPAPLDEKAEVFRQLAIYSQPSIFSLTAGGNFPGISTLTNFCAKPPNDDLSLACLAAAESMRLPGARFQLDLDAQLMEIRVVAPTGDHPNPDVHRAVNDYAAKSTFPSINWANPEVALQFMIDNHELGHFGALAKYRELTEICATADLSSSE